MLADAGNTVTIWVREQQIIKGTRDRHHNAVRLSLIEKLPDNMTITGDRAEAVKNADVVVVAIAVQFARVALVKFKGLIPDYTIAVGLIKGIERGANRRMGEVVCESLDLPADRFVAISESNLSKKIVDRHPVATMVAYTNLGDTTKVTEAYIASYFRPLVTTDVIGLEICGSLKSVTTLAVGTARGAGYGENTVAMIETRGLAELTTLDIAAGADPKTLFGLTGVGDLVATRGSSPSRNYTFGANPGKGSTVEKATRINNGVTEGMPTTDAVVAPGG